ncbi:hypothetical protein F5144DRAFT_559967 [Chaetomium tenue]|uniref:Uncharacterized protein n=3 Tax=Chaetomium tenue TaxID=1854479 RepID=A0ACB7PAE1_9PEZI|nr:hypothetical protein F5144DRAFT_586681 [Chaetomium globosum]KAH6631524.1 hypothetical protein F5144DRAFT_571375 [Chaetomium globosum]KAH6640315.1 hypothetical protein F5144DRAFT_559967 [Chaetomium globosum]
MPCLNLARALKPPTKRTRPSGPRRESNAGLFQSCFYSVIHHLLMTFSSLWPPGEKQVHCDHDGVWFCFRRITSQETGNGLSDGAKQEENKGNRRHLRPSQAGNKQRKQSRVPVP